MVHLLHHCCLYRARRETHLDIAWGKPQGIQVFRDIALVIFVSPEANELSVVTHCASVKASCHSQYWTQVFGNIASAIMLVAPEADKISGGPHNRCESLQLPLQLLDLSLEGHRIAQTRCPRSTRERRWP